MEEDFCKDMMQECLAVNTKKIVNVLVWQKGSANPVTISQCSLQEFRDYLDDIHLQPSHSNPDGVNPVVCLAYGREKWSVYGLIFQLDAKKGAFSFREQSPGERWERWELTPESRRVLTKRLWAQHGDKLRALHIPPPQ